MEVLKVSLDIMKNLIKCAETSKVVADEGFVDLMLGLMQAYRSDRDVVLEGIVEILRLATTKEELASSLKFKATHMKTAKQLAGLFERKERLQKKLLKERKTNTVTLPKGKKAAVRRSCDRQTTVGVLETLVSLMDGQTTTAVN